MTSTYQTASSTAARSDLKADRRPILFLIAALTVALDQITKLLIIRNLRAGQAIPVIPGLFRITHVLNSGAAFSFLADTANPDTVRYALIGFSILAVVIVAVMIWRTGRDLSIGSVALALILGGAIGNLYDRIVHHFVIDFLEVHIVHYHWPDFNVADSAICIGACLLLLEIFRPQRTEN
ncbi:MAG: signal peptidase II [Acidobacteriaceae bacterium]